MTQQFPNERLVYLALKNTFKGADAQIRKAKKVRELIQKKQHDTGVKALIQKHNLDNVCHVAKTLLVQGIFESTLKAKIRFPEVFDVSPAQNADRVASEVEAARSEADAIKSATASQSEHRLQESHQSPDHINQRALGETPSSCNSKSTAQPTRVPSLYPVYLPFQAQHQLLGTIQAILEEACYDFALREMQEVVESQGWDCPECMELNVWARTLVVHQHLFQKEDLGQLGQSFSELSDSISHLRHTAVHRLRVSAKALEQFLIDAESLGRILKDNDRTQRLMHLRRETQCVLTELKSNKYYLESELSHKLKRIAEQRAHLERLEILAMEDMLKADKNYESLAGSSLGQMLQSVVGPRHSTTLADMQLKSSSDPEVCLVSDSSSDNGFESHVELKHVQD